MEPMNLPENEERRRLENLAMVQFGKTLDQLSEAELTALYTAYQAERDLLNAEYMRGEGMQTGPAQGRQAGQVYRAAGAVEQLGNLAQNAAGAMVRRRAQRGLEDLSQREAQGRRAAGQVAAGNQARQMQALASMLRGPAGSSGQVGGGNTPAMQAAAPPAAAPTPPGPPQRPAQPTPPQRATLPAGAAPYAQAAFEGVGGPMRPGNMVRRRDPRRRREEEYLLSLMRR